MERGLYEQLVTQDLDRQVTALVDEWRTKPVDLADQPHVLARHVEAAVQRVLAVTRDPERRLAIVNALLVSLEEAGNSVIDPARELLSVRRPTGPGVINFQDVRPATPLIGGCAADQHSWRTKPGLGAPGGARYLAMKWTCSAPS